MHRPAPRTLLCAAALFCALFLSACASRVGTETIRSSIAAGETFPLLEKMRETHESYQEFVTALNLARVYQLEGQWNMSIAAFDEALIQLEEYENRAIFSMRGIAAGAGTILLARGSQGYYGTGYERSLLHTFNALNYMMLSDFSGAAVEMRKMELRQELWLQESQARLEQNLEKMRTKQNGAPEYSDSLPAQYSMREILSDPAVRELVNNYQDPFSYALSAIFCRLAGDPGYAAVSLRRAEALDDGAKAMFSAAWDKTAPARGKAPAPVRAGARGKKRNTGAAPSAPPEAVPAVSRGWTTSHPHVLSAAGRETHPSVRATESPAANPGARTPDVPPLPPTVENQRPSTQDVTIIAFCGLAPALRVEHIRVPFPVIGYLLLDLPSYAGAVRGASPLAEASSGTELTFYPLLRTDILAYRTLRDEVRLEIASAVSRALVRAGMAGAAAAAAASNKDTRAIAPLAGYMTTLLLDLFTTPFSASVRNWETLPNIGYLAMAEVGRGATLTLRLGGCESTVSLPEDAGGVIIMATQLSNTNLRVQYVAY